MVRRYAVSPHGGFRTHPDIASALHAAARRGGPARIEIAPGHYEETLAVRGEVELAALGDPGSVVVSPPHGTVLDASGAVRVSGLVLIGREADVVGCHTGTLVLDRTEVRAHGGICLNARRHTSVTLTDSVFRYGRTLFAGASGHVERCRFADAADNAVAVVEGARVTLRDSWIGGSRIHGVRVSDAWAEVTGCELTGTEKAAVCADTRAELIVAHCTITAVHADALYFVEQSRGLVHDTRVSDAENGISVESGADPVVRRCVFADCRDTGINVQPAGRGTFEDCEVLDAGAVAVFATKGGALQVDGCRIFGGAVGIALVDKARGRFTRLDIENLTNVALRVREESKAVFEGVRIQRCQAGLETLGNAGTTAELSDAEVRDVDMGAAAAGGQSRITLKGVSAERSNLGFGVVEEAQLQAHDCAVTTVSVGGVVAAGKATLVARNLAVTGSESFGLTATDSSYVDVVGSRFEDCALGGAHFGKSSGGRLVDCSVTGKKGVAVHDNGRVNLVSLRTSLPVEQSAEPAEPPTPVVNHFNGPVFHDVVQGVQLAWNNNNVVQRQQTDENGAGT